MGLSSGPKTTTTQKSNETANSVVTPNNPDWVTQGVQGIGSDILNYGNTDPYSYVAPLSANQNQAVSQAGQLGGWQDYLSQAGQVAGNVANAPANTAGAYFANTPAPYTPAQYNAPTIGNAQTATPSLFNGATLGPAAQATAPTLGPAAQSGTTLFSGANAGTAAQVDPRSVPQAQGAGFGGATLGPAAQMTAAQVGPAAQATAGHANDVSLLDGGLDRYQNPFQQSVVDTTLSDLTHQQGIDRASLAAQAGRTGAFGGSRLGIAQATLGGEQSRALASTDAQLRSAGFDRATALAQSDAALRQGTNLFNAGETGNTSRFNTGETNTNARTNAGFQQDASGRNIDALNSTNIAQGGLTNAAGIATAGNQTQANITNANNALSLFSGNRDATNQFSLANAGFAQGAGLAGMEALNSTANANADRTQQNNLAGYQGDLSTSLANAAGQRDYGIAGANLAQAAGMANADRSQQASMFNATQANDNSQQQAQLEAAARAANAGATNTALGQQYETAGQYGLAHEAAANQNAQFNAGQVDNQQNRQLQAASLGATIGNNLDQNQINDIQSLLATGQVTQAQVQAYLNAPVQQLQNEASLYGGLPLNLFSGQTTNATTTGDSSGTSKTSGGLLQSILGAAAGIGGSYLAGGGKI